MTIFGNKNSNNLAFFLLNRIARSLPKKLDSKNRFSYSLIAKIT